MTHRTGRLSLPSAGWLIAFGLICTTAWYSRAAETAKTEDSKSESKSDTVAEEKMEPVKLGPAAFEQTAFINAMLRKSWSENKITPSALASDYEFIRRVFVDLIGRVATPAEVRAFVVNSSPRKRQELIHKLLYGKEYSEDYATHWANIWTTWTLTRSAHPTYHNQMHLWLEERFQKNTPYNTLVTELITATGKSNDNGAVNYMGHHLGETLAGDKAKEGKFEAVPITSRVTRTFLGLQTQCVQCHDHPFNPEWKQQHFWGVNAYFRQVDRDRAPTPKPGNRQGDMMMQLTNYTVSDNSKLNDDSMVSFERRTGVLLFTKPKFLDGTRMDESDKGKTRRQVLAERLIGHSNFGKAFVNRMWTHLLGRSMTEKPEADDFGEHNKTMHPELVDKLGADFKTYNYNIKELLAWICNSEAYSLSSTANATNKEADKEVFFSRMLMKSMSPEVLFESLSKATNSTAKGDEKKQQRERWMNKLVRNFGDDEGNEITFNGTVLQALLMMNGKELNDEVRRGDGMVLVACKKYNAQPGQLNTAVVNELFLSALNRPASAADMAAITKAFNGIYTVSAQPMAEPTKPNGKPGKPTPAPAKPAKPGPATTTVQGAGGHGDPVTFYQDVFWALLNTNEFILNH